MIQAETGSGHRYSRAQVDFFAPLTSPPRLLARLLVRRRSTLANPALTPLGQVTPRRQALDGLSVAEAGRREVDEFGAGGETAVRGGDEEGPVVVVAAVVAILVGLETTTTKGMLRREDVPLLEGATTTIPLGRHANSTSLLARAGLESLEPGFAPPQQRGLGLGESEEDHFRIGGRDATVWRGRSQSGEGGGEGLLKQSGAALVHVGRARVLGGDVLRDLDPVVGGSGSDFGGMLGRDKIGQRHRFRPMRFCYGR